jgi:hypothetical protein
MSSVAASFCEPGVAKGMTNVMRNAGLPAARR